jgi:hypothetical protein
MTAKDITASRIGEILIAMDVISVEQRDAALKRQEAGDKRVFGELLRSLGLAKLKDIETALLRQQALRLTHEEGLRLLDEVRDSMERLGHSFGDLAAASSDLPLVQDSDEVAKARLLEARMTARHLLACVQTKSDVEPWVVELIRSWT